MNEILRPVFVNICRWNWNFEKQKKKIKKTWKIYFIQEVSINRQPRTPRRQVNLRGTRGPSVRHFTIYLFIYSLYSLSRARSISRFSFLVFLQFFFFPSFFLSLNIIFHYSRELAACAAKSRGFATPPGDYNFHRRSGAFETRNEKPVLGWAPRATV